MTKKSLRFHATVKMVFDYQSVTKYTVAASRRWALTYAFWQWFGRARAGMEDGVGIGSRKGRGPTQWGGPAESSVPARAHDMNSAPSPL